MLKRKKKKHKSVATEVSNGWLDQELTDENSEQVQNVLKIMKSPCLFWEAKLHGAALGKDPQVELQLDESESRITIQPPGAGDSKVIKSLGHVGLRSKSVVIVFLVDILNFVRGQAAFRRKKKLQQYKSLSMSILYSDGGQEEQVDLYAVQGMQGELEVMAWKKGLAFLMQHAVSKFEINPMPILLEKAWIESGGGPGVSLGVGAMDQYFRKNNMVATRKDLRKGFAVADSDGSGKLEQFEFSKVVVSVSEVPFCQTIYDMVTKSKRVKAEALYYFHTEIQKDETMTRDECKRQIRQMTGASAGFQYEDFCTFLTSSKLNSAIDPHAHEVYQNMRYPFANYYVSTTRVPQQEAIAVVSVALDEGCRAFHVEIYAQGGEPSLINPGLVTPSHRSEQIEVADLLSHFRDKAFLASKYPIILVLEPHCRESVQDKLAALLKTYLGFGLSKDFREVTPENCKERFLITVDLSHALEGEPTTVSKQLQDLLLFVVEPFKNGLVSMAKQFEADRRNKGKHIAVMKDYQLSLNLERDFFVTFNNTALSYFVPKNERVNQFSCDAWAFGAQMVGINYYNAKRGKGYSTEEIQEDHHRVAQLGRFAQNGRCGYVLKPHTLRDHHVEEYRRIRAERRARAEKLKDAALGSNATDLQEEKDPQEVDDFLDYNEGTGSCIVKIRLISAHRLPKGMAEISSVYLYLKLVGFKDDEKDYRSTVVEENGLRPEWDESFEFKCERREFDILCFKVFEKGVVEDYLLCQAAIPLSCLRQGYRCVELRDADGRRVSSYPTLFLHVITEVCGDFQSLKVQELAHAEREKRLQNQRARLELEYENIQSAINASLLKQTKLSREARDHRQALKDYDNERLGLVWVNQKKLREVIAGPVGPRRPQGSGRPRRGRRGAEGEGKTRQAEAGAGVRRGAPLRGGAPRLRLCHHLIERIPLIFFSAPLAPPSSCPQS